MKNHTIAKMTKIVPKDMLDAYDMGVIVEKYDEAKLNNDAEGMKE